jgi:CAAX protease family protein
VAGDRGDRGRSGGQRGRARRHRADDRHPRAGRGVARTAQWTVAAFGEEIVYRGYIPTRITDVVGRTGAGLAAAAVGSSLLFGLAHTEQGVIGVAVTFLDGLFFTAVRLRYRSLWAAILAHGFNNTIGLVALFLVGPVYGFW